MPTFLPPASPGGGGNTPLTWNLISSQNLNGLTAVSFTSITGYKYLILVCVAAKFASASYANFRINSRAAGYYLSNNSNILVGGDTTAPQTFHIYIDNCNNTGPKYVQTSNLFSANDYGPRTFFFYDTTAVTSISINTPFAASGAGTAYLFGAN